MVENLKAILIIEILGKPADYVKKTLSEIIESLGKEKNVKVLSKKLAEPKEVVGQPGFFTSFAEVELETSLNILMLLIYGYMPSHVEILEPEEIRIKNSDLSSFFNELAKRLHQYDEIVKTILLERQTIMKQLQEGKVEIKKGKEGKKARKGKNKN